MRVKLWLQVMAGAAPKSLSLTGLVGSRTHASQDRESAYGYKRRFDPS